MEKQPSQVSLLQALLGNAFLLSTLYLLLGTVVEGVRRVWPVRFVNRLSFALDSLPARALELVGAMEPLRNAYYEQRVNEHWLRLVFGATTVIVIFLLALAVGLVTGAVQRLAERWLQPR